MEAGDNGGGQTSFMGPEKAQLNETRRIAASTATAAATLARIEGKMDAGGMIMKR